MWKRKELKSMARQVIKKNYWTAIVVCFLLALLTSEFGSSIVGIWQSNDSIDPNYLEHIKSLNLDISNEKDQQQIDNQDDNSNKEQVNLNNISVKNIKLIEANLNSMTKSLKYQFKIWDAVKSFSLNQISLGISLVITAMIALLFIIIIESPLTVAGKHYFLKARQNSNTKIGVLKNIFKKENWLNVAIIMFFKNIYNILWYLTIVGGIIKTYEYKMIPYILAENPKIKKKEAFKLSKEMMKKNKWKAFLLDASFILWNILSFFTFGLLNILYVNMYISATTAELYVVLRNKAIDEKYEYYENLNDKDIK